MFKKVITGDFLFLDSVVAVSSSAKDLISKLLEVDPCKRISIKQALEHPFLRESDIKGSYQSNLSSFLVD